MRTIKYLTAALSIFFSIVVFSCEAPTGKAFPSISTKNGILIFDEVPFKENQTSTVEEIGINIYFFNCDSTSKKLVGQLPFLANTGKVRAAFFAQTGSLSENSLFVIHSVDIRADTGINYSGDYYTINVYEDINGEYIRNEKLSSYFGDGGDILSSDYKNLAYIFPYKTKSSIIEKLATTSYKNWAARKPTILTINKKTLLYPGPVLAEPTRMFLIKGDKIKLEAVQANWIYVMFKTPKNKEIRGWIKCEDADSC